MSAQLPLLLEPRVLSNLSHRISQSSLSACTDDTAIAVKLNQQSLNILLEPLAELLGGVAIWVSATICIPLFLAVLAVPGLVSVA